MTCLPRSLQKPRWHKRIASTESCLTYSSKPGRAGRIALWCKHRRIRIGIVLPEGQSTDASRTLSKMRGRKRLHSCVT
ncbi:unnamed protein product [Symbiodinium necroappetens]|uniref:Uncharacterized protein n=1 Tax=Symbiodinium necroappetens TaxID=1628268 RepID=A0A813AJS8_9DINO|nr:unnamed protein product [Symbiodinium necroappetens]